MILPSAPATPPAGSALPGLSWEKSGRPAQVMYSGSKHVVAVVPMKEPVLLATVHRIVGRVDVQHQPRRRQDLPGIDERLDQHPLKLLGGRGRSRRSRSACPRPAPFRASSEVLLPPSGAKPLRRASSLPANSGTSGSRRRLSWSLRSSNPSPMPVIRYPTSVRQCRHPQRRSGSQPNVGLPPAPSSTAPRPQPLHPHRPEGVTTTCHMNYALGWHLCVASFATNGFNHASRALPGNFVGLPIPRLSWSFNASNTGRVSPNR